MRTYEIKGPCPELGLVLMRLVNEVSIGEEARIVSKWRYVGQDVANTAPYIGLEVLKVADGPEGVEVIVRRKA
ncbi:MAG: sulfurtransferase TusA family protein [Thermoproteus sp.]